MSLAHHQIHFVPNGCGWEMELKQCRLPARVNRRRNPVAIVPGYGMNNFIFGYHPHGLSMEEYFTQRGFEVWSVNLRAQGGSKGKRRGCRLSLKDLGTVDLKIAIDFIAQQSQSRSGKVDLIGCSLGGTLAMIYAAWTARSRLGALVAIGAPLRWEKVHPLVKLIFFSPRLIRLLCFAKTKEVMKLFFPLLVRSPLLKIYLHPEMVDFRHKELLLQTVEDPNRFLNAEIAHWVWKRDLIVDGENLTDAVRKLKNPLLCVLANGDGIVPPMTALSVHEIAGSKTKETLVVGTDQLRFAHADLFVSNHAHDMVFKPISDWLLKLSRR